MKKEEKTCIYKDQSHVEGSKVCLKDRCIVCKDGQWEDQAAGKLPASESGIPGKIL